MYVCIYMKNIFLYLQRISIEMHTKIAPVFVEEKETVATIWSRYTELGHDTQKKKHTLKHKTNFPMSSEVLRFTPKSRDQNKIQIKSVANYKLYFN